MKEPVVFSQSVRKLRGGSNPLLVNASDGSTYVVKLRENAQGSQVLFNEAAGTTLYRFLGLPVPTWRVVYASRDFIDMHRWLWGVPNVRTQLPSPEPCFGSLYLGSQQSRVLEILPSAGLKRVQNRTQFWLAWLVDLCAQHADNRQVLFAEQRDRTFKPVFIDHGHMFGGPKGGKQSHFCAARYLDPRIYPALDMDLSVCFDRLLHSNLEALWQEIHAIPDEWKSAGCLRAFADCLDTMSSRRALNARIQLLRGFCRSQYGREPDDSRTGPTCTDPVLCSGVQIA